MCVYNNKGKIKVRWVKKCPPQAIQLREIRIRWQNIDHKMVAVVIPNFSMWIMFGNIK